MNASIIFHLNSLNLNCTANRVEIIIYLEEKFLGAIKVILSNC